MTHVTPLHVRSGFSLLRGTAGPERLAGLARSLGYARLALTDVNGLYGATVFDQAAAAAGIVPLTGAELLEGGDSVVALVDSEVGYENLCRIITRIHRRATEGIAKNPKSEIRNPKQIQNPKSEIQNLKSQISIPESGIRNPEFSGGGLVADLVELSAGLQLIVEEAGLAERWIAAGGPRDRLWLAVDPLTQSHGQLRALTDLAAVSRLPLVATGKALTAERADADAARLLAAIRTGATFETVSAGELPHPAAVLRETDALATQLAPFPDAVRNNARLAEQCAAFRLLPRPTVFPAFDAPDGLSSQAYLRRLCREGLRRRYGPAPSAAAEARLTKELSLIERMGFCEYFLVVHDIVSYARRRGVPVAGRGSGASSIVAYVLGLTNVCPLVFRIPFERFLHEGREDFPDLDIDFCWRIRDEVIEYAMNRWGEGRVAMVSTHGAFQEQSAFRETAKAFGYSDDQITRIMRRGEITEQDAPNLSRIAALAKQIIGLPHVLSVHPGGIVIGRKPIDHYVPIQRAAKGVMITQYDKDGVEAAGLVKIDLLGNRNLSTVRYACELLRGRGVDIDIEAIPPDDPATIATLRAADTLGCNQLESPAMRHLLRMLAPSHVRDVMKALALIRPGAASIGMKEVFVRRCRGLEKAPPSHPAVDAVLGETHGVMLYEDDVMLVAAAVLGGNLTEGDRFRRAVQKCHDDTQRLALSREFLARCRAAGFDGDYAKDLWVQMAKFNAYSFCRAHAASYAMLAYAGAYLKTHHPLAFWTAALNNNQSMYHPRAYVEAAKRAGIRFLPPDVNRSGAEFTIEKSGRLPILAECRRNSTDGHEIGNRPDFSIRVGLNFVSGLGPVGVETILAARRRGPFAGLTDLLERTGLPREEARSLVLCGALDFTGRVRPALMMELEIYRGSGTSTLRTRGAKSPDGDLLAVSIAPPGRGGVEPGRQGLGPFLLTVSPTVPEGVPDYSPLRKLADERRILGISTGEHVMATYRPMLAGRTDTVSSQLADCVGRRVRIAGVLEAARSAPTRRDETMRFLTFDDEWGLFEVTVFPNVRLGPLDAYGPYVVTGRVEKQYDVVSVQAESVLPVPPSQGGTHKCSEAGGTPGRLPLGSRAPEGRRETSAMPEVPSAPLGLGYVGGASGGSAAMNDIAASPPAMSGRPFGPQSAPEPDGSAPRTSGQSRRAGM